MDISRFVKFEESLLNEVSYSMAESVKNVSVLSNSKPIQEQVAKAAQAIIKSYQNGGCLFVAGNGGSAADAQHLITELVVKMGPNRNGIKGFALTTDSSLLTAAGNDFGYEFVFSRQIEANVDSKDIFLAITTSGNSANIIKALEVCRQKKITSILLTGPTGGKIKSANLADLYIQVPGENANRIQECHFIIEHTICTMIEKGLESLGLVTFTK